MSAPSVSALIGAEARRVRGTTRAAAACLALLALPLALVIRPTPQALDDSQHDQQPEETESRDQDDVSVLPRGEDRDDGSNRHGRAAHQVDRPLSPMEFEVSFGGQRDVRH